MFGFLTIILISLILIQSINAEYEWASWGGDFQPAWNVQYQGTGEFDIGISNQTKSSGMTIGTQPLVSRLNYTLERLFLVVNNGNDLEAYRGDNLNLASEVTTTGLISELDVLDWDNDGYRNDIAGIYLINSTLFSFRIHTFNVIGTDMTKTFEQNFTVPSTPTIAGVRHLSNKVVFVYGYSSGDYVSNFTIINSTDTSQFVLPSTPTANGGTPYNKPLGFWNMDSDSKTEFMTFSNRKAIVFDEDGTLEFEKNYTGNTVGGEILRDAKIFAPDCEVEWWEYVFAVFNPISCPTKWRIAIVSTPSIATNEYTKIEAFELSGTSVWSDTLLTVTGYSGTNAYGSVAITDDYNGDNLDDLYAVGVSYDSLNVPYRKLSFKIYKSDGTILKSKSMSSVETSDDTPYLVIADMDANSYDDFILTLGSRLFLYEPTLDKFYMNETNSYIGNACIPADLNRDGFLELICSKSGGTVVYSSSYSNQNAVINSVTFSPSTLVSLGDTLYSYTSASDIENHPIVYRFKCSSSEAWSNASSSNVGTCVYDSVGIYNLTVGVRDIFYSTYDIFSQEITVTELGLICDNDDVCESSQGETYINCPNDCPTPTETTQVEGGIAIPLDLVNTEDTDKGLLPEIYYGTLGFFSSVLEPSILLIFVIFFVLIMITIGAIVVKIAKKVSNLG